MKVSCVIACSLVASTLAFWSRPVAAQHHKPAVHAGAGQAHMPQGNPQGRSQSAPAMTPQQQKAMQKQMEVMMQEEMKQQEQMYKMQQQQKWMNTQKHNKALGKSYDPKYDQMVESQSANNHTNAKKGKEKTAEHERLQASEAKEHAKLLAVGSAHKLPLAQDQSSISLLRTVHRKLQTADHDYDGHRMQAIHHISAALKHLGSPVVSVGTSQNSVGNKLNQSASDAVLSDALVKLRIVENHLSSKTSTAVHHGSARTEVASSLHELHTALNVR